LALASVLRLGRGGERRKKEMLEAARGLLTPVVLFVLVNVVIATIAVVSRLMPLGWRRPPPPRRAEGRRLSACAVARCRPPLHIVQLLARIRGASGPPAASDCGRVAGNEDERERKEEEARIKRSRSEAPAELAPSRLRPRARSTRMAPVSTAGALSTATNPAVLLESIPNILAVLVLVHRARPATSVIPP
jgi:hypothetical protein